MLIKLALITVLAVNYLQASSMTIMGGIEDLLFIIRMLSQQPSKPANSATPTTPPGRCQELDETPVAASVPATKPAKLTRQERTAKAVRRAISEELRGRRAAHRRDLQEEAAAAQNALTLPATTAITTPTTTTTSFTFDDTPFTVKIYDLRSRKTDFTIPSIDPKQFLVRTVANPSRGLVTQSTALCGYESPRARKEYLDFFDGDSSRAAMQRMFKEFLNVAKTEGFSGVRANFPLTLYTRSNDDTFELRLNRFCRIMFRRGRNGEVIIIPGIEHHKQQDRR